MNIAFIGIGQVGSALAGQLVGLGHTVKIAARDRNSDKVKAALAKYPNLQVAAISEAIATAEIVFLATPFSANQTALAEAGDLSGKILVDCTNPVGAGFTHGLNNEQSGGEFVQNLVPNAKVVKAFTIYGFEKFENNTYPGYGDLKPAMLIAGNDPDAKQVVANLCIEMGWEPVDTGNLAMSLHLEHMTLLWIKMARLQGLGSGFVWAKLQR
ncbi:NADPH-dependent F420 reductase [Planktothricoides raciborskii]|uniref:NADPH-dependent F420 reductase n=2 Tax=Planktothricoides raciborskii TaxID=132608 RepID=A0AAU8JEL6_9CYAN|nr:NADPH-dependent F420 reductase [Planktothricoides raciborskii]MBD2544197.1 NADPH-dependent F420 reductase [Planktothricoides raciborskii FACHB-1370]MBD2583907.1 NADPH-dependent F420 reductase [Planktothricoides raciborskii FACHB-1261]